MSAKKVLLIDDDVLKDLFAMKLNREGYETIKADNGRIGIEKVEEFKDEIGLIVLDMMMPEIDGLKFLKLIRGEMNLDIPVIVMTSVTDPDIHKQVMEAGALEICIKPIKLADIESKVKAVLG